LLRQFVDVDYADHLALVAFLDDQMIGVGRLIRLEDTDHAEADVLTSNAAMLRVFAAGTGGSQHHRMFHRFDSAGRRRQPEARP
jgi:hypothetical protein